MKRINVLGITFLAIFAFGVLTASASAVTFLKAQWLLNGAVTANLSTESAGELELINTNGGKLGITAKALCSGIFVGTVGAEGLDWTSEVLNLAKEAVSLTELSGLALTCTDTSNCENPTVYPDGFPGESEAVLMVDGTEEFQVDLLFNVGWYVECTVLGTKIAELCISENTAVKQTNETSGVDGEFSDGFQTLAGGKLAICAGSSETGEVNGLGTTVDPEGTLSVSE